MRNATPISDLDVLLVADKVCTYERDTLIQNIKSLHYSHSMSLDNEIPYEYKVMVDVEFMQQAVHGDCIRSQDKWIIPKIEKTVEFLTSPVNLKRFFLGMMTHPHIFVCGDYNRYKILREQAFATLIKALSNIHNLYDTNLERLLNAFCGETHMSGDFYLGYSANEPFLSYLSENLLYRIRSFNNKS
jgi:hypothetical protein